MAAWRSDLDRNRAIWAVVNEQFTDAAADDAWRAEELSWGLFVPLAQRLSRAFHPGGFQMLNGDLQMMQLADRLRTIHADGRFGLFVTGNHRSFGAANPLTIDLDVSRFLRLGCSFQFGRRRRRAGGPAFFGLTPADRPGAARRAWH